MNNQEKINLIYENFREAFSNKNYTEALLWEARLNEIKGLQDAIDMLNKRLNELCEKNSKRIIIN